MGTLNNQVLDLFGSFPSVTGGSDTTPATPTSNFVGISTSNPGAAPTLGGESGLGSIGSILGNAFAGPLGGAAAGLAGTPGVPSAVQSGAIALGSTLTGLATPPTATSLISAIFLRSIVVITGFIFVAVGLSMFGVKTIVTETVAAPIKGIAKGLKQK